MGYRLLTINWSNCLLLSVIFIWPQSTMHHYLLLYLNTKPYLLWSVHFHSTGGPVSFWKVHSQTNDLICIVIAVSFVKTGNWALSEKNGLLFQQGEDYCKRLWKQNDYVVYLVQSNTCNIYWGTINQYSGCTQSFQLMQ